MTLTDLIKLIQDGGVPTLLILILIGGAREWWVWGHQYRIIVKERNDWMHLALRNSELGKEAVSVLNGLGEK